MSSVTNTHLRTENLFDVRDGHLELRVLTDGGHHEVLEFAKLVNASREWSMAAPSITTLTILGSQTQPANGIQVPYASKTCWAVPLDIDLLLALLKALKNLKVLTLRDLWVSGGGEPYKARQSQLHHLVLDNICCSWNDSNVDFLLILSLFSRIELLQFLYIPPAQNFGSPGDLIKTIMEQSVPTVLGLAIHTPGPELAVYLAPVFPIFSDLTSLDVNCRTSSDVNALAVLLLGGIGKRLTWFALDLSTLQFTDVEVDHQHDIGLELEDITGILQAPLGTLARTRCFTLRIGSVSVDPLDARNNYAFYKFVQLIKCLPVNALRHLALDFDTYCHYYPNHAYIRHEIAGLQNSWTPQYGDPNFVDWQLLWDVCRHFKNLSLIELLWGNSSLGTWKQEDQYRVTGYMHEFSHFLKDSEDSRGASCSDPHCVR